MHKTMSITLLALLAGLLAATAATALDLDFFGKYETVSADPSGRVRLPLDDVSDGKAHYYEFETAGGPVRFFVLQSPNGIVRAAFDACDVCFREGLGYDQDGEFMICNNCGQRFHSDRINVVRGGCNPAPLERSVEGEHLVLSATVIRAGLRYFPG